MKNDYLESRIYITPSLDKNETANWYSALQRASFNGDFDYLPCWYYAKNLNGDYLANCDIIAKEIAGFKHAEEFTERNDFDMPWEEQAPIYLNQDKVLVKQKRIILLDKITNYKNKELLILSSKAAIQDASGHVVGAAGFSINLTGLASNQIELTKLFSHIAQKEDSQKQLKINFAINSKQVSLTRREAEVLHHIARGKSMKETARLLELSARTVEFYLGKAKDKTGCVSRSQLIEMYWNN